MNRLQRYIEDLTSGSTVAKEITAIRFNSYRARVLANSDLQLRSKQLSFLNVLEMKRALESNEPLPASSQDDPVAQPVHKKQHVSSDAAPLDQQAIDSFIRDGFVLLRGAFSAAAAQKGRELIWTRLAGDGITQDSSTWVERHGIPELYTTEDDPAWGDVVTPRLKRAMDQICGKDRWEDFGLGWWIVTFPGQAQPPWGAAGKWHVDGASYQHHVDSKESGLLAIFLFSDIESGEGGTALSVGSHKWVARLLEMNEPRGMKGGAVSYQARQFRRRGVVEVNGKAGDVMLVHPFMLHARSKNLGQKGVESVRIMCNPNVQLHRRMNVNRADGDYSPVEQAIVEALEGSTEDDFNSFRRRMLRRHPTRVEERADVAAEYEAYLQEKERQPKARQQPASAFGAAGDSVAARQEARRQDVRARIGLDSSN
ncbi:hypothetical protein PHYPSEUDO_002171 [Phytophthora pseudosyringae]|uniref:Phytanoyl-CoA dioxygenase n=1 Tax=Phytophthora pseudosyringae TaxID=221518 RepID=A0A8T1VV67_9STRA|nr:hypothetical protein PHYPSEUDO_002171 [Phytophthora pseudosyringae]